MTASTFDRVRAACCEHTGLVGEHALDRHAAAIVEVVAAAKSAHVNTNGPGRNTLHGERATGAERSNHGTAA